MLKLQDIIENAEKNKGNLENTIKVESFIDYSSKATITDNVSYLCTYIDEYTQMMEYALMSKNLYLGIFKVLNFTNIELDIDLEKLIDVEGEVNSEELGKIVETYDLLERYCIIDYVNQKLENDNLEEIIDNKIQQKINNHNSVANVVRELFEKLPSMEDIGNLLTSLPSELKDLNNLKILKPVDSKTNSKSKKSKNQ